jgi:hypothetical protein
MAKIICTDAFVERSMACLVTREPQGKMGRESGWYIRSLFLEVIYRRENVQEIGKKGKVKIQQRDA